MERRSDARAPVLGVDMDEARLWANLEKLAAPAAGLRFSTEPSGEAFYYSHNSMYGAGDAAVLASMISRWQPKRIVEVGSGFSTAVVLDAVGERAVDFTTIDPDPSRLDTLHIRGNPRLSVVVGTLQSADLALFEALGSGDFLILDSSHVGKAGSDVLWYLFEVFPRLASGVLIHIHDVFSGFEYPIEWMREGRSWNEAYLLRAFLEFNARFELHLWPQRCWTLDPARAASLVPQLSENSGGQIWLRVRD